MTRQEALVEGEGCADETRETFGSGGDKTNGQVGAQRPRENRV